MEKYICFEITVHTCTRAQKPTKARKIPITRTPAAACRRRRANMLIAFCFLQHLKLTAEDTSVLRHITQVKSVQYYRILRRPITQLLDISSCLKIARIIFSTAYLQVLRITFNTKYN